MLLPEYRVVYPRRRAIVRGPHAPHTSDSRRSPRVCCKYGKYIIHIKWIQLHSHSLFHLGTKAKEIALGTRGHLLLDYVLTRRDTDGQSCLAAVAGNLHVGQVGIANWTLHCLVVNLIAQLFHSLGRLTYNGLDLLGIAGIQLIAIVRTHQHRGVRKGWFLKARAMAFNDRGGEYGHDICGKCK